MNRSAQYIVRRPGLRFYEGAKAPSRTAPTLAAPELYLVSADEMKDYLDLTYGIGSLIYDATTTPNRISLGGRKVVQGVIAFDWQGRIADFGASGHVDLFQVIDRGAAASPQFVPGCAGACYWQDSKQPMKAYLWETAP